MPRRGRDCVAHTVDISLWVNMQKEYGVSNHNPSSWKKFSISYQHNRLWNGDPQFLFDERVNDTTKWETLSYTSLLVTVSIRLGAVVIYRLPCVELELGYGRLHDYNYCPMCRELGREQSSTIISECPRWLTTAAVQYTTS